MTTKEIVEKLITHIKANYSNSPLMINVSGCTGAGKSTRAENISDGFQNAGKSVTHVSEDDFLQPREYQANLKIKSYEDGEWKGKTYWENHENWLRLDWMREVITNLGRNKGSSYYPYLRSAGNFAEQEKIITPAEIVVFETSIFSELFDVVILADVDDEVLLKRKLNRDSDLRGEEEIRKYHEVQLAFWNKYKPQNPNYIIDNNDFENPRLAISRRETIP